MLVRISEQGLVVQPLASDSEPMQCSSEKRADAAVRPHSNRSLKTLSQEPGEKSGLDGVSGLGRDQATPGVVGVRPPSRSKKVVLFLPPYSGPPLGPPVGLLSLASTLQQAGYEVKVIDGKIVPEYLAAVEHEAEDALCFGVSLLTGPMIKDAVAVSRRVKQRYPELPVVFGGWHPSLLPEQTLREPFVDAVVRHQGGGEITFLEVVKRLGAGQGLDLVAGCSFKRNGRIHRNPDRPVTPIDELPPPAYGLVDFDAYEKAGGGRQLPFATSVGCPYACKYCTDTVFYNRRFNAYSPERVVEEVTRLVHDNRIEQVSLLDSNFLVNTKRAVEIARGFSASGQRFSWTFQASTDLLCRLSDEEVCLLGKSGVSHIGFGTESASEEVLQRMNKLHQTVLDMFETARKCRQAGIRATFNLIFGYPGETEAHRRDTLRVMAEIAQRFDNVSFSPNIFTPYPGIPVWPELEKQGMEQPKSLEAWAEVGLGANVLPWMSGEPYRRVKQSMSLFLLANEVSKLIRQKASRLEAFLLRALRQPLCWRLKHQFYRWPIEVSLFEAWRPLVTRRSLLTGRSLH